MENDHIKKIRVYFVAPENSGVALYRFWQPLEDLREKGLIELKSHGFDFSGAKFVFPSPKQIKDIIDWADIVIVGRFDVPEQLRMIETFKAFGKEVLLDIDDNIFAVSPYLQAHQSYNPDGEPLKIHKLIAKTVDGIIVSTQALKDIYDEYNRCWIVENGIKYVYNRSIHDGVNIGYMCSSSHLENAQIVEGAIIRVLRKFPQARFFYTKAFQGFMERIPTDVQPQINYTPFFPLKDYLKYVNNLNLDIGIAPLMDNPFNQAKSNIRVLEYWQNKTAVIASPSPEYSKTIQHGFNGYLAQNDEWEYWLTDLIQNTEKRNYLIQNSTQSLKEYDVSKFAQKYYEVLREITDGKNTR